MDHQSSRSANQPTKSEFVGLLEELKAKIRQQQSKINAALSRPRKSTAKQGAQFALSGGQADISPARVIISAFWLLSKGLPIFDMERALAEIYQVEIHRPIDRSSETGDGKVRGPKFLQIPAPYSENNLDASGFDKLSETLGSWAEKFSPVDILGGLYQHCLADSTKKRKGLFYTPPALRQYIWDLALGDYSASLAKMSPRLAILDPAMGAGGFLVDLVDRVPHLNNSRKQAWQPAPLDVYGMDVDPMAIDLAQLALMLSPHPPTDNIHFNFTAVDAVRVPMPQIIKAMPAAQSGFSIIVGNPPFFEIPKFPKFDALYPLLTDVGKPNIAALFLVRYAALLQPGGILVFVFPASLIFSDAFTSVRTWLVRRFSIIRIVQLGKMFSAVGLEQIVLFLRNAPPPKNHKVRVHYGVKSQEALAEGDFREHSVRQAAFASDSRSRFLIFGFAEVMPMLTRFADQCVPLGRLVDTYPNGKRHHPCIFRGLGLEKYAQRLEGDQSALTDGKLKIVKGNDLMRYGTKSWHTIPARNLPARSSKLDAMRSRPKLGLQRLVTSKTRIVAAHLAADLLALSTVEILIFPPTPPQEFSTSPPDEFLAYILAVLNSDLMAYYIIDHVFFQARLSTSLDRKYLECLPIWPAHPKEIREICNLVHQLSDFVSAQSTPSLETENLPEYIALDQKINANIFRIYQITPAEQAFIRRRIEQFYGSH